MAPGPLSRSNGPLRPAPAAGTGAFGAPPTATAGAASAPHGASAFGKDQTTLSAAAAQPPKALSQLPGTTGKASVEGFPARTVTDARQEADRFWHDPSAAGQDLGYRRVERDAYDLNAVQTGRDPIQKVNDFVRQLRANEPLARAALDKLSGQEKGQYHKVLEHIENDPAELAFQLLLIEGKLTDPAFRAKGGKTLLATLGDIATQPLYPDLDRARLLSDLVQEIALPSAINQQSWGTCAATSLQILMALQKPAEYARLVGGLASPTGNVQMAGGAMLARADGTTLPDDSHRTTSSRLIQAAFMEYANGSLIYDNQAARHLDPKTCKVTYALLTAQRDRIMDALYGKDMATLQTQNLSEGPTVRTMPASRLAQEVDRQTRAGQPVPVALRWGDKDAAGKAHDDHMVLVTGMANDRVYFDNPWGKQESMSVPEFKSRAYAAHVDAALLPRLSDPDRLMGDVNANMLTLLDNMAADRDALVERLPNQPALKGQIDGLGEAIAFLENLQRTFESKDPSPTVELLDAVNAQLFRFQNPATRQAAQARLEALLR